MAAYKIRRRGGEPPASQYWRGGWSGIAKRKWDAAVAEHYAERASGRRVERYRLAEGVLEGVGDEEAVGVNEEHGVDFLNTIIPQIIKRVRDTGSKRKIRILDLGCGLGFFTDQIRSTFPNDVVVFGTSIENPVQKALSERQKKIAVESVHKKYPDLPLSETLHPNDAKVRSVLEMRDFEEFDLIIDTSGEFLYAGKGFMPTDSYFDEVLSAAVQKLAREGHLYVSRVHDRDYATMERKKANQGPLTRVKIDMTQKGHYGTAFSLQKTA